MHCLERIMYDEILSSETQTVFGRFWHPHRRFLKNIAVINNWQYGCIISNVQYYNGVEHIFIILVVDARCIRSKCSFSSI